PLSALESLTKAAPQPATDAEAKIVAALAKLSPEDRTLAEAQRFCVVLPNSRLGSMGPPIKIMVEGEPVFVCCAGCKGTVTSKPQEMLSAAKALREKHGTKP